MRFNGQQTASTVSSTNFSSKINRIKIRRWVLERNGKGGRRQNWWMIEKGGSEERKPSPKTNPIKSSLMFEENMLQNKINYSSLLHPPNDFFFFPRNVFHQINFFPKKVKNNAKQNKKKLNKKLSSLSPI